MNERELLGATSKNRLIRLAALALAIWSSTKTPPSDDLADGHLAARADLFEGYIRAGKVVAE